MDTFVTMLGHRPAAFASAYRTLVTELNLLPGEVQLWSTSEIDNDRIELLKQWLGHSPSVPALAQAPIQCLLGSIASRDSVDRVVELSRNLAGRVVFFADAGTNFHIAMAAKHMPADVILVHCDDQQLLARDYQQGQLVREDTFALHNLGLTDLLSLYGVSHTDNHSSGRQTGYLKRFAESFSSHFPTKLTTGLRLSGSDLTMDLAFERQGLLYAAFEVFAGEGPEGRQQAIREIRALASHRTLPIRPEIAIVSNLKDITRVAAEYGLLGVKVARDTVSPRQDDALVAWVRGDVTGIKSGPTDRQPHHCMGGSGVGPPCIISLSDDPSSTLVALYAHQPRIAYVCYDHTTPRVVSNACQLTDVASDLPVGELRFVPTDNFGRGLHDALLAEIPPDSSAAIHCNISPGTKAQSALLARLDCVQQLWSIDNGSGVVRCLTDGNEQPKLPTPLLVQATVVGGPLLPGTVRELSPTAEERTFFLRFAQFLWRYASRGKDQGRNVDWRTVGGIPANLPDRRRGDLRQRGLTLTMPDGQLTLRYGAHSIHVEGRIDQQPIHGTYPPDHKPGEWLELLVGHIFASVCDEAVMNLAWERRLQGAATATEQRAEVDIAARWGHAFYTAECKTSTKQNMRNRRYVLAVTKAGLGRFARPFVVYPIAPAEPQRAAHLADVLDLRHLADVDLLREELQGSIARARQKSGRNP